MVDRPQHLRERFYQGLRKDLHQKMTPFYRDHNILYMQLLRLAREIEEEQGTAEGAQVKGAGDRPSSTRSFGSFEGSEEASRKDHGSSTSQKRQDQVEGPVLLLLLW